MGRTAKIKPKAPEAPTLDQDLFWTVPVCASRIGVCADTISSACCSGQLTHRRVGLRKNAKILIEPAKAKAWAEAVFPLRKGYLA